MIGRTALPAICAACLISVLLRAHATEIHVTPDSPGIQAAIESAEDGDVVIVSPGRYKENISFLGKAITVRSTNPSDPDVVAATIIDGDAAGPCVTFENDEERDSVLTGFTVTNGDAADGGGIQCFDSSPTIRRNVITGNHASTGGGGASFTAGSALFEGNTVVDNTSDGHGALFCQGSKFLRISDNIIAGNTGMFGAGVSLTGNDTMVLNNIITGNTATFVGSGMYVLDSAFIAGNVISGNINDGALWGAIFIDGETPLTIVGNTVTDHDETGIIWTLSDALLVGNTIARNTGGGAGVYVGRAIIVGNTIERNSETGLATNCSQALIADNVISGNSSNTQAGGIDAGDGFTIIINNTVVGNRSNEDAGGIRTRSDSTIVENCIVAGNTSGAGGQISAQPYGVSPPALTIRHSLIEGGQASVLLEGGATLDWEPGNIDDDPRFLDPGQWNDAGTPDDVTDDTFAVGDYHLLPGSPCIDAGTNDFYADGYGQWDLEPFLLEDVAGLPRIIDGDLDATATADIGAYEYRPGDVNYDGKLNVLDLLQVRNNLGKDPSSNLAARRADVNADGNVDIMDLIAVRNLLSGW